MLLVTVPQNTGRVFDLQPVCPGLKQTNFARQCQI